MADHPDARERDRILRRSRRSSSRSRRELGQGAGEALDAQRRRDHGERRRAGKADRADRTLASQIWRQRTPRYDEEICQWGAVNILHALPLTPTPDPFDACIRFAGRPYLLFLDSSAQGALSRYSFLTADPVAVVRTPEAGRELLRDHETPRALPGLPPFQTGIAGYISYE